MKAALFDLDGTLVDSAPTILQTFRWVLDHHGVAPAVPLDHRLIGPPLREVLGRLAATADAAVVETLAASFRERYDDIVVAQTPAYPGVAETITAVRALGYAPFIATNKRIHPTRLILAHLGVADVFAGIYALDASHPPAPDKAAMVAAMILEHRIAAGSSVLVGDSIDDSRAAEANGIRFIEAAYGYGAIPHGGAAPAARLSSIRELPAILADLAL